MSQRIRYPVRNPAGQQDGTMYQKKGDWHKIIYAFLWPDQVAGLDGFEQMCYNFTKIVGRGLAPAAAAAAADSPKANAKSNPSPPRRDHGPALRGDYGIWTGDDTGQGKAVAICRKFGAY